MPLMLCFIPAFMLLGVVPTVVSAVTRALQSFSLELLDEHLAGCVLDAAARGGKEADDKVREASEAIARLVRS